MLRSLYAGSATLLHFRRPSNSFSRRLIKTANSFSPKRKIHIASSTNMRLVQFKYKSCATANLGVELPEEERIVDLVELGVKNLIDFLKGGDELMEKAKK